MAFVLARLRALDTAGVLGRTSSLFRAALVAMSLQELAYQILAPPVQFPFEFALAHLPGFAGREEGFGIREQHRPLRTGLGSGDRCKGRRFAARRMYVPGILSSQPSQACLPSHGTVPERRVNVQKGARLRGTDRRCSAPFRGSAGRRKDAGTRWLGCCPPEMSTGETHPRAKRPMNRGKTPLRRRAAPRGRPLRGTRYFHAQSRRQAAPTDSGSPEDVRPALDLRVPPVPAHSCRGTGSDVRPQCAWGPYVPGGVGSTGAARCAARPHALELGRRAGMVRLREHGPDDVAAGGSGRAFRSEAASRSSRRQRSD